MKGMDRLFILGQFVDIHFFERRNAMKRVRISVIMFLALIVLAACAGIQAKWDALTPDEQARIILNGLQSQVDNALAESTAYVAKKPELQTKWKTQVIPAFDVANKAIASAITLGKTKPLTPAIVYAQAQAQVSNLLNLLIQMGAIKSK